VNNSEKHELALSLVRQIINKNVVESNSYDLGWLANKAVNAINVLDKAYPEVVFDCHLGHPKSCDDYKHQCYKCKYYKESKNKPQPMPCSDCYQMLGQSHPCYWVDENILPYVEGGYVDPDAIPVETYLAVQNDTD